MRVVWIACAALHAACTGTMPRPIGAIAVAGEASPGQVLRAAERAGGAVWHLEPMASTRGEPAPDPAKVEALEQLYVNVEFDACLAAGLAPEVDVDQLVARGAIELAARSGVTIAACSHHAHDLARAEEILTHVLVLGLDVSEALAHTRADFQSFADEVHVRVVTRARHDVEVATRPQGATIAIDGHAARCDAQACRATVIDGEHVVVAEAFGHRRRVAVVDTRIDKHVTLALDPAPPHEAREQLAGVLAGKAEQAPPPRELGRVATDTFGARVVVLVRGRPGAATAWLFDRSLARVATASTTASDTLTAAATAVEQAIDEWRNEMSPPVWRQKKVWIAIAGAVIATTATVYFITRDNTRNDLVFK